MTFTSAASSRREARTAFREVLQSDSPQMESAGSLIGRMNRARRVMSNEDLARAAWPKAVGATISKHSKAISLVRTCLIVEVEDMIWQRQLYCLRTQILKRLIDVTGPGIVDDIALRPMTPRRMPQRAETVRTPIGYGDEADAIGDPLLRRVYLTARRKASA